MKNIIRGLLFFTIILFARKGNTQDVYTTSGGEFIFSWAKVVDQGNEEGTLLRFTPFINLQTFVHYDIKPTLGFMSGLAIRNVGFIYEVPGSNIKKKFRSYNLGLPIGIKIGKLDKAFIYGGYEIELPFNYKEKTFVAEEKTNKFSVWFSDRTPTFYHSIFVGIQLPYGANLKFKYYFTPFFDEDYAATTIDGTTKPYSDIEANVLYISLSVSLLKNAHMYTFE